MILGAPMPAGCRTNTTSERCVGWLLDRILITAAFTPYRDAVIAGYVAEVGHKLVAASGDRRPWAFRVLDSTEIQAFAGMSTTIYVNRGALALLRDESELAGVLGHEIGHVLGGHTHESFEELAKDLASATRTVAEHVQSARDDEIQADETAVLLLVRAGYDPHGVERMLRAYAATAPSDGEDASDRHPAWVERIARVQAITAGQPAGSREEAAFRARMAPLVVGADPRNGELVGGAIVFARAGLAVDLPAGTTPKRQSGSFAIELDDANAIDLRLINAEMAPWFSSKPDKDGIVAHVIRAGSVALAISAKGPAALAAARHMFGTARRPRAAELQAIAPAHVDFGAPRLLWLPPS
jgi:predicted Zn-dependent protease